MAASGGTSPPPFPSVDAVRPDEEGGPNARSGFNYQDEIAVGFLIEMLETSSLLKVHCETHDDLVLVRSVDGSSTRLAEFVQVKAVQPDKLWSIADICVRKRGKIGTSIFEISFGRDKHCEESRFRLVTLRPVVSDLKILTFPCNTPGRHPSTDCFKALQVALKKRFRRLKSPKGNGLDYWLQHCVWDVRHSEDAVRSNNLIRLLRLSGAEGRQLLPEPAEMLLEQLRTRAKDAGAAKWNPDPNRKIIRREALRHWWEGRTRDMVNGAATLSGGKLTQKMNAARLPIDLIELAVDMRRNYADAARTSRYMEPLEAERLQARVKSEVMSLRARFVAGQLPLNGVQFHALCLDRMDAVNAERPVGREDRSAFLKGCMYDIADRCLLRFESPGQ